MFRQVANFANNSLEQLRPPPPKRRRPTLPRSERKCDACRVRKCKCLPVNRNWEKGERCQKCVENGEACGLHRRHDEPQQAPAPLPNHPLEPIPPLLPPPLLAYSTSNHQAVPSHSQGYSTAYDAASLSSQQNQFSQTGFESNPSNSYEIIGQTPTSTTWEGFTAAGFPPATHQVFPSTSSESRLKQG